MGKISAIFIVFLCMSIVGYILLSDYTSQPGWMNSTSTQLVRSDNPLLALYSRTTDVNGNIQFQVDNSSQLFQSVPQVAPSSFLSGAAVFIDRIFIILPFIRTLLGVVLFPVTFISILGLPWQVSMMLAAPMCFLYIIGLIDLISGGSN